MQLVSVKFNYFCFSPNKQIWTFDFEKKTKKKKYKFCLLSFLFAFLFGLFFATPLLELHRSKVHDGSHDHVDLIFLFLGEAQNVKGFLGVWVPPSLISFQRRVFLVFSVCVWLCVSKNQGRIGRIRGREKYSPSQSMDTVRFWIELKLKRRRCWSILCFLVGEGDKTAHEKIKEKKEKRRLIIVVHRQLTTVPSGSACSSRPLCLNFIVPRCMTAAVILQISGLCSPIPKISKASYIFLFVLPIGRVDRTQQQQQQQHNSPSFSIFQNKFDFWIEKSKRRRKVEENRRRRRRRKEDGKKESKNFVKRNQHNTQYVV